MMPLRDPVAKDFRAVAYMKQDAHLAPLRQRKDFQQLVVELEKR